MTAPRRICKESPTSVMRKGNRLRLLDMIQARKQKKTMPSRVRCKTRLLSCGHRFIQQHTGNSIGRGIVHENFLQMKVMRSEITTVISRTDAGNAVCAGCNCSNTSR